MEIKMFESLVWTVGSLVNRALFSNPMVTLLVGFAIAMGWGLVHMLKGLGLGG